MTPESDKTPQNAAQAMHSHALAMLLQLEKRARQAASESELLFTMANESHRLVPFRQAAIWSAVNGHVAAVSGTPTPESHAPYIQWAERVAHFCAASGATTLNTAQLPPELSVELAASWNQWFPPHALWLPLIHPHGQTAPSPEPKKELVGGMLLGRDTPWNDAEITLLTYLAETYAHGWLALQSPKTALASALSSTWAKAKRRKRVVCLAVAAFVVAISFVPVPLTTLGQAEVVPRDPAVLRSPLDGIIEEILVEPNAPVKMGQPLVRLDVRALSSQYVMAEKARDVDKARLLQASQQLLDDKRVAAHLAVIRASIAEREAEVTYLRDMLARAELTAPFDGVALYSDKSELIGRPVRTGERIVSVANPTDSQMLIWLSTQDAIHIADGAKVRLFLNSAPDQPVEGAVVRVAFMAAPRPEGFMAYRLEAAFAEMPAPRVGLRGVAKVYGDTVSLAYYLFRRPLVAARQWLGF